MPRGTRLSRASVVAAVAVLAVSTASGCLRRTLEVRSDPPGADVWIDGVPVGATPMEHEFTFYGTVDVEIRKPGYRAAHVEKTLHVPWYEVFPLDFFTEFLVPVPIHDVHRIDQALEPYPPIGDNSDGEIDDELDVPPGVDIASGRDRAAPLTPADHREIDLRLARLRALVKPSPLAGSAGEETVPGAPAPAQ